jgi:2-(1,2-epoxy-1,2-dihydrophenyl)acetyl-CoA isomerase
MMANDLVIRRKEGAIAWMTLNRPDRLNALNAALGEEILDALDAYERDEEVRVIIITGAGRAFCAGDDLRSRDEHRLPVAVRQYLEGTGRWPRIVKRLRAIPKPVIAMVNGHAHGAGFDTALACDFRFASEEATFCHAYILRGLASGTAMIPRYVGIGKATELLFTGRRLSAAEADELGLVTRVVAATELESVTRDFAVELAQGATRAMGLIKAALNRSLNTDLDRAFELQAEAVSASGLTMDVQEGRKAFAEKRPPKFTGQ